MRLSTISKVPTKKLAASILEELSWSALRR